MAPKADLERYLRGAVAEDALAAGKMAFVSGPRQVGKTVLGRSLLQDRDKLEQMAVRAQKAGWSFLTVAVFAGLVAGVVSVFVIGVSGAALVSSSCLFWGYLLGMLARRGYLPFPESGD